MTNEEQDSKILVTGGLGAIGKVLSKTLYGAGRDVIVYDSKNYCNTYPSNPSLKVMTGDIRDGRKLLQLFRNENITGIIHLAAISQVGVAEKDYPLCASVNAGGTYNLMAAIEKSGKKPWIVNCSSREVYGNPEKMPVPESNPLNPINHYGMTKVVAEGIVKDYVEAIGLNAITLRPSNIYGSAFDLPERMIPRFINNALFGKPIEVYGGEQVLDLLYVSDAVDGFVKAILRLEQMTDEGYYDEFNLATGNPHTIQEVVHHISRQININIDTLRLEPRLFDVQHFVGDPRKAQKMLGFKAKVALRDGISATVGLYQKISNFHSLEKIQNMDVIEETLG